MGNYLDKDGLTRFKEKMLTEVDKRIATGGGSGGDAPTKEEIIESATRVSDVEVELSVATVEALQTAVATLESKLQLVESWQDGTEFYKIYSDGTCEQGGRVDGTTSMGASSSVNLTANFYKEMASTNYFYLVTNLADGSYSTFTTIQAPDYANTTTSMRIAFRNLGTGAGPMPRATWFVKGKIKG